MRISTFFKCAALIAGILMLSSTGFAGILANGSFSFTNTGGLISYVPGDPGLLINATSVTIPSPTATGASCPGVCEEINSIGPTYLGLQNDFAAGGHTPLGINNSVVFDTYTFDLSFTTFPTFTFTVENGKIFQFVATSGQKGTTTLGRTDFLNVEYTGTFSDTSGLNYLPGPASLSLTFTQTGGASGTLGYAGTFATPPTSSTPEPATMAMLGFGLIAMGAFGRKRLARR